MENYNDYLDVIYEDLIPPNIIILDILLSYISILVSIMSTIRMGTDTQQYTYYSNTLKVLSYVLTLTDMADKGPKMADRV